MHHISYSELSTFQSCPRKHRYLYSDRRVPLVTDQKIRFGTLMHELTAAWWTGGPDALLAKFAPIAGELGMIECAKAAAMMRAYHPPNDQFSVLGVEVPFEVPLHTGTGTRALYGVRLHGFADMLLRENATGRVVVREYKTTTSEILGFGQWWDRLALDAQVAIYHLAFDAAAVVYDVSRVPSLRPSAADRKAAGSDDELAVAEAYRDRLFATVDAEPEEWHQWRPQWKTVDDLRAMAIDLVDRVRMLRHCEVRNLWPMAPGSCRGLWGVCPYLDVCAGRVDLHDETRFVDREERRVAA